MCWCQVYSQGVAPAELVPRLLEKFLVHATVQRLAAYRKYREEIGGNMTLARMERLHWSWWYDKLKEAERTTMRKREPRKSGGLVLKQLHIDFCGERGISEDALAMSVVQQFALKHEQ